MPIHKGECFCGVQIEVSGEPEGMGYCHCRSCRWWSAAPEWKSCDMKLDENFSVISKQKDWL